MDFKQFLKDSGWTRAQVARKLGLSRGALTKWEEVPEKWVGVLALILTGGECPPAPVARKCHPKDLPDDELEEIIRNRSSTTDWDICQAHGWRIWEFNEAIAGWVKRNPYKKPENGYDLSKYKKGEVVE